MEPTIEKISAVTLRVANMMKSVRFYGPASIAPVVDPAGSSDLTIQCPPSLTIDKMTHFVESSARQ
jgi:hypothetical protein